MVPVPLTAISLRVYSFLNFNLREGINKNDHDIDGTVCFMYSISIYQPILNAQKNFGRAYRSVIVSFDKSGTLFVTIQNVFLLRCKMYEYCPLEK